MADAEDQQQQQQQQQQPERPPPPEPRAVEYDPITGVPAVFNEFLPHDCAEWKKWKAAQEGGAAGGVDQVAEGVGALSVEGGAGGAAAGAAGAAPGGDAAAAATGAAAAAPAAGAAATAAAAGDGADGGAAAAKKKSSSKKAKDKPRVVLETNTRNKKKCITTVTGLDHFGVKLSEAAKAFGKKFACGSSVVKTPSGGEQIDMQGDFLRQCAELIVKNYAAQVRKADVYFLEGKSKTPFWPEEAGGGEGGGEAGGGGEQPAAAS
jgi:density-regulated protein